MNYQAELEKILKSIEAKYQIDDKIAIKPKLLLHACCGPCSSYVLEYLNRFFDITIFYYNPNIHPEAEYTRRLEELEEFLPKFSKNFENPNINLIKEEYNPEDFYSAIKIKENPEFAKEKEALEGLKASGVPVILAVNKVDTVDKQMLLPLIDRLKGLYEFSAIVPISAQKGVNVEELTREIRRFLPEGPKFFPDDTLTDQPEKQIVAEFIREKALRLLNKEIPHGIAVEIEKMKIRDDGIYDIEASIYCERKSHKGIIIGKNGAKLKDIGSRARVDIERFLDAKVYLKLWVKVNEDWRNKEKFMNMIGFE